MSEVKKVLFIINKYSGTGYEPAVEGKITDLCSTLGYESTLQFTQGTGHATELARQAVAEKFNLVFAMGGDGTVNETAAGLVYTNVPLGILPKGSGNGLARHLRIPLNFQRALRLLQQHEVVAMDTLLVNNHISVNVSGIGFDGLIANKFGQDGTRGLWGYTRLTMREYLRFGEFGVDATIDGRSYSQHAFMVAFANASQFGNNACVSPLASVRDGQMDVCFIRKVPFQRAIGFGYQLFTGRLNRSPLVTIVKGSAVNITFPGPMPYHIDGEGMQMAQQFAVQLRPASLKVLVPQSTAII